MAAASPVSEGPSPALPASGGSSDWLSHGSLAHDWLSPAHAAQAQPMRWRGRLRGLRGGFSGAMGCGGSALAAPAPLTPRGSLLPLPPACLGRRPDSRKAGPGGCGRGMAVSAPPRADLASHLTPSWTCRREKAQCMLGLGGPGSGTGREVPEEGLGRKDCAVGRPGTMWGTVESSGMGAMEERKGSTERSTRRPSPAAPSTLSSPSICRSLSPLEEGGAEIRPRGMSPGPASLILG